MRRRPSIRLVALALAAALGLGGAALLPPAALAAPAAQAARAAKGQNLELWEQLGGTSRLCKDSSLGDIGADAHADCKASGSIISAYPTDSYGLDNNVDVSVSNPGTWIGSVLQWLISTVWLGLVYLVRGALMLLEWAFTTDLYRASHKQTDGDLARMYAVVGAPWMTFVLSVAGLWGLWNGLVRRRAIETLGGLAAAVALMLVALVIISRPQDTVGYLSRLANQAAVGALSVGAAGTVQQPGRNLADADRALFDAIVLRPWCSLQFGDVDYCVTRTGGSTVADVWLTFPPNSTARQMLFRRTKDGGGTASSLLDAAASAGWTLFGKADPGGASGKLKEWYKAHKQVAKLADKVVQKSPAHVELQESGGTMRRFALLAIVAIGIAGAVAVIGAIAIRLLIDGGLMLLVLLLLAPLALLAPAFGEKGRQAFLAWGKKLLAALAAKLVFSVLLSVVILVTNAIAGLQEPLGGWLPCWLIEGAFWWSLFLRRHELLGMLGMDSGRRGGALSQVHYAMQLGRSAQRTGASALKLPFRPVRAVARPLRRNAHAWRAGEEQVVLQHGQDLAGRRAREVTASGRAAEYAEARELLDGSGADRARQAQLARELRRTDGTLDRGRADDGRVLQPSELEALRGRRDALAAEDAEIRRRQAPSERARARSVVARGPDAPPMDDRDVQRWLGQRRADIDSRPWDDDANLRAAGIDPGAHRRSVRLAAENPDERRVVTQNRQRAEEQMRLDRVLLAHAGNERGAPPMSRGERRARLRWIEQEVGQRPLERQVESQARAERRRTRAKRSRDRLYR